VEKPKIFIPRAIYRGGTSSEKVNLFMNQFIAELYRICSILNTQRNALEADISKTVDDSTIYEDSVYHRFKAEIVDVVVTDEDGNIKYTEDATPVPLTEEKPVPIKLEIFECLYDTTPTTPYDSTPVCISNLVLETTFTDIRNINHKCNNAIEKAKFILRSLG
jgi:hypothetical protein